MIELHTVEFQKRGLPHVHILLWVDEEHKCKNGEDADHIICAEIPNKNKNPRAYKFVSKYQMHGPCGDLNPNSPCMKNDKCSKGFPKKFCDATVLDASGFPTYRRRNDGQYVEKSGVKLDNRWVVPYNLNLILRYDAHINMEICCRDYSIKYLFKYVTKGPDKIRAQLRHKKNSSSNSTDDNENEDYCDEIRNYLDCCYVTPCEAMWRINEFHIHDKTPSVERLQYHEEEKHLVAFPEGQNVRKVLHREGVERMMFTAWMEMNALNRKARGLTYLEFPTKFRWNKEEKVWQERKQGHVIGRLYYAPPNFGERYYLRMLSHVQKGPASFNDLKRTPDGRTWGTFRETCYAMGLLGDDSEWEEVINEAARWAMCPQLRELFVMILMHYEVSNPASLWSRTWKHLTEGILEEWRHILHRPKMELTEEELKSYTLYEISKLLSECGKTLEKLRLPTLNADIVVEYQNSLIIEELDYDRNSMEEQHLQLYQSLNEDQLRAYNAIMQSVDNNEGKLFFVSGPGGTGKTHLWNTILTKIKSRQGIPLPTASSGIAAILLPKGRTAHSRFNIPHEDLDSNSTCNISKQDQLGGLIQRADIIIWDEAPLDHKHYLEAVDQTIRDLMVDIIDDAKQKPFGGKTVVLGGDFRQCLPIIQKVTRAETIRAYVCTSRLWNNCVLIELQQNVRILSHVDCPLGKKQAEAFASWVLSVGNGTVPAIKMKDDDEAQWIEIPKDLLIPNGPDALQTLIATIYPNFVAIHDNHSYLKERAIITPKNVDANHINSLLLDELSSQEFIYHSHDYVERLPNANGVDELQSC